MLYTSNFINWNTHWGKLKKKRKKSTHNLLLIKKQRAESWTFIWMMIKSLPSVFDGRFFKCWWNKRIHFKMNTLDCFFFKLLLDSLSKGYWNFSPFFVMILSEYPHFWILNGIFWTIKLNSNTWLRLSVIQECDF